MSTEPNLPNDQQLKKLGKRVVHTGLVIGLVVSGIVAAGGATLALAGIGPLSTLFGVAAAAGASLRIATSLVLYPSLSKGTEEALEGTKSSEQILDEARAKHSLPKYLTNPKLMLATSIATLGAGIALFGAVGPWATAAAVTMAITGGFGTVTGAIGLGFKKLASGFMKNDVVKSAVEAATEAAKPQMTPAPTSKLDQATVAADFKAANSNQPAATETVVAKPANEAKPPKVG